MKRVRGRASPWREAARGTRAAGAYKRVQLEGLFRQVAYAPLDASEQEGSVDGCMYWLREGPQRNVFWTRLRRQGRRVRGRRG